MLGYSRGERRGGISRCSKNKTPPDILHLTNGVSVEKNDDASRQDYFECISIDCDLVSN